MTFSVLRCILTGRFWYVPISSTKLKELLHVMNEFCRSAEDEITFNIYLITQIPGVAVDYFYDGHPSEAEGKLLPFLRSITERFGPPGESSTAVNGPWEEQTTSYVEYQQRFREEPVKTYKMWKSAFLGELTPKVWIGGNTNLRLFGRIKGQQLRCKAGCSGDTSTSGFFGR